MTAKLDTLTDATVAALTLWGEARGEPLEGQIAVALVIRNRVSKPGWWGRGLRGVLLAPWQFSCWNQDDPNRPQMLERADDDLAPLRQIVRDVILRPDFPDFTKGADGYHTTKVKPSWAEGRTPNGRFGAHLFYRVGLRGDGV